MKLHIGEKLKKLRNEKKVTQDELANYLGVSFQAVSRWENELAYPDIEFLPELARFFEVSLEELLDTEGDNERIMHTISECYLLSENNKSDALALLHSLEREHPTNWCIKQAICRVLVQPKPESYDEVLPELRKYAIEGLKKCSVKDAWPFHYIVSNLIKAVPESEVKDWIQYMPIAYSPNYNTVLAERYKERGDLEKAIHYSSESIFSNLLYIGLQYRKQEDSTEGIIASCTYYNAVINAVIGEPYKKDDKIHNSIMIFERAVNQTRISAGYAELGQTERALTELEKAIDLWSLEADALKEEYFTSDSPFLENRKVLPIDKFQSVDYGIDALTNSSEWKEFDSVREDYRFLVQLKRIEAKKKDLDEWFRLHKYAI